MDTFIDVDENVIEPEEASGTTRDNVGGISIGSGSKSFRADSSGIWMGADKWEEAPFRVDMNGNMTASSANLTGSGYSKVVTFAQATIPTSVAIGDLWVDTDNENRIYRAESVGANEIKAGEWVDVSDSFHLEKVGGSYTTTLLTAAKVQIFPTTDIGIRAYASNGTSVVFQVDVGGANVGDVLIGNYAGGYGVLWDQSAGKLYVKGDVVAGNIDAARISSGTLSASRIPSLSAEKITSGYLSASRIEAGSLNASVIGAGTINASTITVTNLNASNINKGTLNVGASGKVSQIIIDQNSQGNAYLRFGSSSGSRIWCDTNGYIGMNALGGEMYFYVDSYQKLVLLSGSQAIIGRDVSGERTGLVVWGNTNVRQGDMRINDGKLRVNTTASTSETFHVGGAALIEGNLKSNHHDPRSSNSYNLGGDSQYWDYVYADTYVDKSMGWYDAGVHLPDGRLVSDMEGIKAIKPHPTQKVKNGAIKLDKRTLPLEAYIPAMDRDTKVPYPRNDDNEPYNPETGEVLTDGGSITQLVSIIIGALKELDNRIEVLEKTKEDLKKRLLNIEKGNK